MKRTVLSLLFSLALLTSYAQTTTNRIWQEGFRLYVADKEGRIATPYIEGYEFIVNGNYVVLRINGAVRDYYLPSGFLNKNGVPYSTVSPELALDTFKWGADSNGALFIDKFTDDIVADRTTLLMLAPVAKTLQRVYVVSDSKYGNVRTQYLIYPNGDRYLMASQQQKDN